MNEVACLLLSSSLDYSTDSVCLELEKREIPYLRINRDQLHEVRVSLDIVERTLDIDTAEGRYSFTNNPSNSVFFRAPTFSRNYHKVYSVEEQLHRGQWAAFFRNLIVFDKIKWVNNPVATYRAENKVYQLAVAKESGLLIPQTLVTNHTKDLYNADVVAVKSIDTVVLREEDSEMFAYTSVVSRDSLSDGDLRDAPVFVQEYLKNKKDIRVAFIGDKLFSFQILKEEKGIYGDWRRIKKEELLYVPFILPPAVTISLKRMMDRLELRYGGIDLIESEGSFFFIEVNPTGEWYWLQSNTGIDLCGAIVGVLNNDL